MDVTANGHASAGTIGSACGLCFTSTMNANPTAPVSLPWRNAPSRGELAASNGYQSARGRPMRAARHQTSIVVPSSGVFAGRASRVVGEPLFAHMEQRDHVEAGQQHAVEGSNGGHEIGPDPRPRGARRSGGRWRGLHAGIVERPVTVRGREPHRLRCSLPGEGSAGQATAPCRTRIGRADANTGRRRRA